MLCWNYSFVIFFIGAHPDESGRFHVLEETVAQSYDPHPYVDPPEKHS